MNLQQSTERGEEAIRDCDVASTKPHAAKCYGDTAHSDQQGAMAIWRRMTIALLVIAVCEQLWTSRMIDASLRTSSVISAGQQGTERMGQAPEKMTDIHDDFETYETGEWSPGSSHGDWEVRYDGHGSVGIETAESSVHFQRPMVSTVPDETHASLTLSSSTFHDVDITMQIRTIEQLRQGSEPNNWEVAWVVWHYSDDGHFYYFIPKPDGWELGKVDNTKADPAGSECTFPSYENCRYEGAQRFLAVNSSVQFPTGSWYTVRVRQVENTMTVWVDDTRIVQFTDTTSPYHSGQIGMYNEDAWVQFDDIRAETSMQHP